MVSNEPRIVKQSALLQKATQILQIIINFYKNVLADKIYDFKIFLPNVTIAKKDKPKLKLNKANIDSNTRDMKSPNTMPSRLNKNINMNNKM